MRIRRPDVPHGRILRPTPRIDERAPERLARLPRLVHLEREREDALAARAEEHPGRFRLVVRLENLEDAVLRTQHDLVCAEARDVDRILEPLEAERALVDRDRAVE